MNKINTPARQGPRYIFYFLMFAILGWFIFMQIFGADERSVDRLSSSVLYSGTFTWEKSDGTTQKISIPGDYDVPAGETMVITTILPEDFDTGTVAIRSSLQDVNIYVDGSLRTRYTTRETRLVGKNSASRYIFCPTSQADAGKELRIELTTYTSNYSGIVNQVFCGDKADIWQTILNKYGFATYIALFYLVCRDYRHTFQFNAWAWYITSILTWNTSAGVWLWVLSGCWASPISDRFLFLMPQPLAPYAFVMILLCPIPLLLYADCVQHGLHHRLYCWIGGAALLDFAICTLLQQLQILRIILKLFLLDRCILIGTFLIIFIHLCLYTHAKSGSDRSSSASGSVDCYALCCSRICFCIFCHKPVRCLYWYWHADSALYQHTPNHSKYKRYGKNTPAAGTGKKAETNRRNVLADDADTFHDH